MAEYRASDLFLDQLVAEGTKYVFGNPGPCVEPITKTFASRSDIHYVLGLHEGIAVSMALGYAQVTGKAGVAILDAAAGLANGLSAIQNASLSHIPLVVAVGQHDLRVLNQMQYSDTRLHQLASDFCKWSCELKSADELSCVVRRAFHEAMFYPSGPAVIVLPVNLLKDSSKAKVQLPPRITPLAAADHSFLKRVAGLLVSARKPAVILGNEIWQYRARKEAVSLAEVLGCPAFCEPVATGINFPNQHQLFSGVLPANSKACRKILTGHDVILVCGMQTRASFEYDPEGIIPVEAVVAQLNVDPGLSGRSLPCHFSACADLAESLSKLRAEIQLAVDTAWVANSRLRSKETAADIKSKKEVQDKDDPQPDGNGPITAKLLLRLLDSLRPPKSVLVNDAGSHADAVLKEMKFESSGSYLASNARTAGYGLPAALGAQWANPEATVICLTGDGSFLYYPQALWTASHYGLSIKLVVLNNQGYGSLGRQDSSSGQDDKADKEISLSTDIKNPPVSLVELAGAMAVPSSSISKFAELEPAIKAMFETSGPYLLDVRI